MYTVATYQGLSIFSEEVLKEDLFAHGVDMRKMAAQLPALFLGTGERHHAVQHRVLGPCQAALGVVSPPSVIWKQKSKEKKTVNNYIA